MRKYSIFMFPVVTFHVSDQPSSCSLGLFGVASFVKPDRRLWQNEQNREPKSKEDKLGVEGIPEGVRLGLLSDNMSYGRGDGAYSVDNVETDGTSQLSKGEEECVRGENRTSHLRHGVFRCIGQDRRSDQSRSQTVGHFSNEEMPPILREDLDDDGLSSVIRSESLAGTYQHFESGEEIHVESDTEVLSGERRSELRDSLSNIIDGCP